MIIYLNDDWKFCFKYSKDFLSKNNLESVRIPHTVKLIDYNYINEKDYQTVCGYARTITYKKEWKNKRIFINFDGVGHKADVYLNDKFIVEHECGYTGFKAEITDDLKKGKNTLIVKVDTRESLNVPPFGNTIDYLCYGGIYRDVYLSIEDKDFIEDVYAYPVLENGTYKVNNTVEINGKKSLIRYELLDNNKVIKKGATYSQEFCFTVAKVHKWTLEDPYLYKLRYYLEDSKEYYETNIAFRTVQFKADGFYLNGKKTKLMGLDRHQAYAYVGYAMPDSMQRLDVDILKDELSCNIVRTSHYPQAHSFYDECDRKGLLVLTEIPGWQYVGDKNWQDVAVKNTGEMVKQYRRHPSIILWGVRINESKDNDNFYARTNKIAHEYDPYRPTTGIRDFEGSSLLEDAYAHNDFSYDGTDKPGLKDRAKAIGNKENMDHGYIVTEYCGHMYPTKPFDDEIHRLNHALRHATVINSMYEHADIAGCMGWCMNDYNTHGDFGSGDRICYHGVMDMFRNPKLASYVYASQGESKPVLYVSSHMNNGEQPELNIRDVYIFTNGDYVKMYKNDKFVCDLKPDKKFKYMPHPPIYLSDHIGEIIVNNEKYKKETALLVSDCVRIIKDKGAKAIPERMLKALEKANVPLSEVNDLYGKYIGAWGGYKVTYRFDAIKDGKVIKSITKKPCQSIHLDVKANTNKLIESKSYDVAEIFIKAIDDNDNIASYYQESVTLKTSGPIEIIGPSAVSLKAGQVGVYVKTTGKPGDASLTISSGRFKDVVVKFKVSKI